MRASRDHERSRSPVLRGSQRETRSWHDTYALLLLCLVLMLGLTVPQVAAVLCQAEQCLAVGQCTRCPVGTELVVHPSGQSTCCFSPLASKYGAQPERNAALGRWQRWQHSLLLPKSLSVRVQRLVAADSKHVRTS